MQTANAMRQPVQLTRTSRATWLRKQSRSLIDGGLWLVVASVIMLSAIGLGFNRDTNMGGGESVFTSTGYLSTVDTLRVYNRISLGICAFFLVFALTTPGSLQRIARLMKTPIIWAVFYQLIIDWHYFSDGAPLQILKSTGVWLVMMGAMAASPTMAIDQYKQKMTLLFRMIMWLSLGIGIFMPDHAWGNDYFVSLIPGVYSRFYGVAIHANEMGALAGIAVLMELDNLISGTKRKWVGFLHFGLAGALLILTQSKTSFVACVVCAVYLALTRRTKALPRVVQIVLVSASVFVFGVILWVLVGDWVLSNKESLSDLSGRTELWRYYFGVGLERPWLGYGRELWTELQLSQSFRYKWAAGNAHNQFLNSFLMTGFWGFVLLIVFLVALYRSRNRMDRSSRIIFTACLIFMIIRCNSEAGFEPGDGGIQAVLVGFCLCGRRAFDAVRWMKDPRYAQGGVNPYGGVDPYRTPNPYQVPIPRRAAGRPK